MSKLRPEQKRARNVVASLQMYIGTYTDQPGYLDYPDITIINDVIYGLGLALNRQEYTGPDGFTKFKRLLKELL